jgi:hypothetical protein
MTGAPQQQQQQPQQPMWGGAKSSASCRSRRSGASLGRLKHAGLRALRPIAACAPASSGCGDTG